MYDYQLELPNLAISRFVPRFRLYRKPVDAVLDLLCFEETPDWRDECNINSNNTNLKSVLTWQLIALTSWTYNKSNSFIKQYPSPKIIGDIGHSCRSLFDYVQLVSSTIDTQFKLQSIVKAEDMWHCLAIGHPVVVGGSIYSSFITAQESGVVPMPTPGESLLGGHAFCLVGYSKSSNTYQAFANLGASFGAAGVVALHDSYLRNLRICRDFFTIQKVQ